MSNTVLADAQFSVARILKPFAGFESVYQGLSVQNPIAIPGNLDRDAGKQGFDPNLLAGVPVPFGSKMVLWIPTIFNGAGITLDVVEYQYRIVWRMRNIRDFRTNRSAYHFPRQSLGASDQYVIPAAANVLMYEGFAQTQQPLVPGRFTDFRSGTTEAVVEAMAIKSAIPTAARTPAGATAAFQQGLAVPTGSAGSNTTVTYNTIQVDVMGDEFILLVNRPVVAAEGGELWDFSAGNGELDNGFSAFYGNDDGAREPIRDLGIYVFTGSNP